MSESKKSSKIKTAKHNSYEFNEEEEGEEKSVSSTGHKQSMKHLSSPEKNVEQSDGGSNVEELNEQEILDIAEQVFIKISQKMLQKNLSLRSLYGDVLQKITIGGETHEILQPNDFIDAFRVIDIASLEEIEIECLLRVLLKPEIDDTILFSDLIMILDNFGVSEAY